MSPGGPSLRREVAGCCPGRRRITGLLSGFLAVTLGATGAQAQQPGRMPIGMTTVPGAADSVFERFAAFLQQRHGAITALDRTHRSLTATLPSVPDEGVVFRFEARGDSTRIIAHGVRGGALAMIMGLAMVNDLLHTSEARPDTSPAPTPPGTASGGWSVTPAPSPPGER